MEKYSFKEAVPVWEKGKTKTMHHNLIFRSIIKKGKRVRVAISASSMYQMFVNGKFVAEGPARAGHGYYRVDEIDITSFLSDDDNIVAIYVDGYYIKNFYLIKQPSFLCAEIISDEVVVAATGKKGFEAKYHSDRIRKIVRYSYQRTFAEAYRYDSSYKDFETKINAEFAPVVLSECENKKFIVRGVPYPSYEEFLVEKIISKGTVSFLEEPVMPNRARYVQLAERVEGFNVEETEIINSDEIDKGIYTITSTDEETPDGIIASNGYSVYTLPLEKTGFLKLEVEAFKDTELIIMFDEIITDGDFSSRRNNTEQRSIIWFLKQGKYSLISNEPYSMKYIKIINKSDDSIRISNLGINEFAFDFNALPMNSGNKNLDMIYSAAVESFRQNTLDIYMDCPSRERAGWLCDSFFTARVEKELTGKSVVEKNFLENFIMAEGFNDIDKRMLPMCYPADSDTGSFIPNWAMWYVIEVKEYIERSGDIEFLEFAKKKIFALLEYFEEFENSDGLLEKLENWVFVEWSKANEFTQDINYPTNMLYAWMLEAISELYGIDRYLEKAERIRETIRRQSYFDGFFHDHAVRCEDGSIKVIKEDITETCQYYAFYTKTADRERDAKLWDTLLNDFGTDREEKGLWKEVYPSNAFIGYYLRLDLLAKANEREKLLKDIEGFFLCMAQETGTLWEHKTSHASCNHGFASHVIIWLNKFLCS